MESLIETLLKSPTLSWHDSIKKYFKKSTPSSADLDIICDCLIENNNYLTLYKIAQSSVVEDWELSIELQYLLSSLYFPDELKNEMEIVKSKIPLKTKVYFWAHHLKSNSRVQREFKTQQEKIYEHIDVRIKKAIASKNKGRIQELINDHPTHPVIKRLKKQRPKNQSSETLPLLTKYQTHTEPMTAVPNQEEQNLLKLWHSELNPKKNKKNESTSTSQQSLNQKNTNQNNTNCAMLFLFMEKGQFASTYLDSEVENELFLKIEALIQSKQFLLAMGEVKKIKKETHLSLFHKNYYKALIFIGLKQYNLAKQILSEILKYRMFRKSHILLELLQKS